MIRVLLIDDSPIALELLSKLIASAPDMMVAGMVRDAVQGLNFLKTSSCDVICCDYYMPNGNADDFVKTVMQSTPKPILIISAIAHSDESLVFHLLELGAVDVLAKPRTQEDNERHQSMLSKIRVASGVHMVRKLVPPAPANLARQPLLMHIPATAPYRIVAIGASTGGPQALKEIFSLLPKSFPLPIVCIQHIGPEFTQVLVDWLDSQSALHFAIARHGERPAAGNVYFAPPDRQIQFDEAGRMIITSNPGKNQLTPSLDLCFGSLAKTYGKDTIAVILTGMGNDGTEGMKMLSDAGALTIAQDEESSLIFSMPQHAIARGGIRHVLALRQIAEVMRHFAEQQALL